MRLGYSNPEQNADIMSSQIQCSEVAKLVALLYAIWYLEQTQYSADHIHYK